MKNTNILLIIVVVFLLISNIFFGYMFFFHKNQPRFGGEFPQMQLTDEQIKNIKTFFENTTNIDEIANYCESNRMECFYYCREINSNHEYCSQLMQRRPNSQQIQEPN